MRWLPWKRRETKGDAMRVARRTDPRREQELEVMARAVEDVKARGEKVAAELEERQRRNHWTATVADIVRRDA